MTSRHCWVCMNPLELGKKLKHYKSLMNSFNTETVLSIYITTSSLAECKLAAKLIGLAIGFKLGGSHTNDSTLQIM